MKAKKIIAAAVIAFCGAMVAFAQTWTQSFSSSSGLVDGIASSADGTKLFAVGGSWSFDVSTNSGASWVTITEPQIGSAYGSWTCIACSANGNTLVAMSGNGVWASTNSGVTWISNNIPAVNFWTSVALSADGTKAVAVDGRSVLGYGSAGGGIYTSTNSGLTWSQTTAPIEPWTSVASSADGTILAAAVLGPPLAPVYVSTNSGATWTPTGTPTNMEANAIAASADGRKLIVVGTDPSENSMFYTSTNSGNTWISNTVPLYAKVLWKWDGIASSADGTRLAAVSQGAGVILTSTNSGATWSSNSVPVQLNWFNIVSSADGTKLAALSVTNSFNGGIWTLQTTPSPAINLTTTNSNLVVSWLIPSTNFVLQQNSNLAMGNWSNVANAPALNLTNLQNQVTLPAPAGNAFFRLRTQ